jgi:hypothetical protein
MITHTHHAAVRAQQRAIPPFVEFLLDEFGERLYDGRWHPGLLQRPEHPAYGAVLGSPPRCQDVRVPRCLQGRGQPQRNHNYRWPPLKADEEELKP